IMEQPKRVATRLGTFAEVSYALAPRMVEFIQNVGFRLFPSNTGSAAGQPLSVEGVAFAHLMRGVHF
ncbi:MAG: short chain dehydrogenase, partial [Candidatus Dadabacteria bacterium]